MEKKKVENREEGVYYSEEFENNCCDKCHDVTFEKTYPAHTAYHACMDLKCKCHSLQKESEWEKEFEKVMECIPECANGLYEDVGCPAHGYDAMKAVKFFRGVLSNREKEIAEEVKRRKGDDDAYPIWNDTLDEIISFILKNQR